ncbi:MAG: hypothetical protein LUQ26_11975, partial [Methylococcaceae bacterium]|nr:hypothetical protein [Methylococcaceae bacterium]
NRNTSNTKFLILKYQHFSQHLCGKNIILDVIQEYFHCLEYLKPNIFKECRGYAALTRSTLTIRNVSEQSIQLITLALIISGE